MSRLSRRRSSEAGYVALLLCILFPVVFLGLSAVGVDMARWYVEIERVQKSADAGALAGVPYMPQDLASATTKAKNVTARNGYDDASSSVEVTAAPGSRPSQLRVTVSSRIDNSFGSLIGAPSTTITRTAVADYTGPAPMGSPCNTFGNEPLSQIGAAQPEGTALPDSPYPGCDSRPYFWAAIEGPETDKMQGDRYSTIDCGSSGIYGCDSSSKNEEYLEEGFYFAVNVQADAVGQPIEVQLYDPGFVNTSVSCSLLRPASDWLDNMNEFVTTDGKARYGRSSGFAGTDERRRYCSGDYYPGGASSPDQLITSFVLREQTDTQDPMKGAPITGCTKQYGGRTTAPSVDSLKSTSGSYNRGMAKVFHSWVNMCTFTPTREGDYYLQVRTNVSLGGTVEPNTSNMIYSDNVAASAAAGNTSDGEGLNSFAIRAVPASSTLRSSVSVAGWSRMPILQNSPSSTAQFNLIRALPAAGGQFITFDFFDAGDATGSGSGTVQVLRPTDATGSITNTTNLQGCKGTKNLAPSYTSLTDCKVTISSSTHNGQLQTMAIPIPSDYNCDSTSAGGCWFLVKIDFPGVDVTDFTTWDGSIGGDPVRLIE